jgi:hypothetical protein
MSGYADDYKDQEQAAFIRKWVPEEDVSGFLNEQSVRYTLARARYAEAELRSIRDEVAVIHKLIMRGK